MARGIQDIANGLGYLYIVATDGTTIESVTRNTAIGAQLYRSDSAAYAPLAAMSSAYGIIEIGAVAGAGSITAVDIAGNNQIGANIVFAGGETAAVMAGDIAAAINAFTPGFGFDYTAINVGDDVYIYAPVSAGAAPNGFVITVSDTGAVITYTAVAFTNGSADTGLWSSVMGKRFFIDADYGVAGIPGSGTANPTSLANALEITKYMITRGMQVGALAMNRTIASNTLSSIARACFFTVINVVNGVPNDIIAKLAPEDFVEGDMVVLRPSVTTDLFSVESATVSVLVTAPNIYLTNDVPFFSSQYNSLVLQYRNDPTLGPIFVEVNRSLATNQEVNIGATIHVSSLGDDTTASGYDLMLHYRTIPEAITQAVSGDTIIVHPGNYTVDAMQKDGVNIHFMEGCTVDTTSGTGFGPTNITMKVTGYADFISGTLVFATGGTTDFYLECNSILSTGVNTPIQALITGGNMTIKVRKSISSEARCCALSAIGAGRMVVEAEEIILTAAPAVFNPSISNGVSFNLSGGSAYIKANKMYQTIGGSVLIFANNCTGGSIVVDCPEIYSSFATFESYAIYAYKGCHSMVINGNLYCNVAGSQTIGLVGNYDFVDSEVNVIFNGDISCDTGAAVYLYGRSTSGKIMNCTINGSIYANTSVIPTLVPIANSAVVIMRQDDNPAAGDGYHLQINGDVYQNAAGGDAIFKGMLNAAGNDDVHFLTVRASIIYVVDPARFCIAGEVPVGVTNDVYIGTLLASIGTDANITEVGGTTTIAAVPAKPVPVMIP